MRFWWRLIRKPSFHRRLAMILLAAALLSTLIGTGFATVEILTGPDGWIDQTNRYVVRIIAAGINGESSLESVRDRVTRFQVITEVSNREEGLRGETSDVALQITQRDQTMIFRSPKAPHSPFPWMGDGVHRCHLQGQTWWVASAATPDGRYFVHVGSSMRDRLHWLWITGGDVGWLLLFPSLLSGALALLAVRAGLRPLSRLAAEVQGRSEAALDPIEPPVVYEETKPLLGAINTLLSRARQHLDSQRLFIAEAAHELRTPLAVIAAQAHRIVHAPSPEELTLAQADLQAGLDRSSQMISQLLTIARLESVEAQHRQRFDLEWLLRDIVRALAPVLLDSGCELGLTSPGPTWMSGDPIGLRSAVENLVRNAGKYAGHGALVDVVLVRRIGEILIQVIDDGAGVPEVHRSRLAERFFRVPGTQTPGSGLGLAIARRAAENHGGVLELGVGMANRGFGATLRLPWMPSESGTSVIDGCDRSRVEGNGAPLVRGND